MKRHRPLPLRLVIPLSALLIVCIGIFAALLFRSGNGETASLSAPTDAGDSSEQEIPLLPVPAEALRGKVVILDPGHGFGDTGCAFPGSTVCERDITPVLVKKLRAVLEQDGVTVLQTHDGKTFPTASALEAQATRLSYDLDAYLARLVADYSGREGQAQWETVQAFRNGLDENGLFSIFERSYYANLLSAERHADLFVSIHVNANEWSAALCGFDLFSCADTPHADDSARLMEWLEFGLKQGFPQTDLRRTVYAWEDAFAVNKYPDMPSVLIESGYATNPQDAARLQDPAWQNAFARAVADGIELFLFLCA